MRRIVESWRIAAGLVLVGGLSSGLPANAQGLRAVDGVLPAKTAVSRPLGHLDTNTVLHFTIGLAHHNQAALTALLSDLQNPASPKFHHWLTPEQFRDQFGPSESDYEAVRQWAESAGFKIAGTFPEVRDILDLQGDVPSVERAFNIHETLFQDSTGRTFYSPDQTPTVPDYLPAFSGIQGLDNANPPHSNLIYKDQLVDPLITPFDSPSGPPAGTTKQGNGPGPAFTPADERSLYGSPIMPARANTRASWR